MTQPKPRLKFTVSDYMSMPDNGKRYELLDGEIFLAPSPTFRHQGVQKNLVIALSGVFERTERGWIRGAPLDVVFSDGDVAQPDVMFISNERSDIITDANVQGAPDLAIEILSPGTVIYDRGYKRTLYGRHGVLEYWLVDPEAETVEIFVLGDEGLVEYSSFGNTGELSTPVMGGDSIDLAELFRPD